MVPRPAFRGAARGLFLLALAAAAPRAAPAPRSRRRVTGSRVWEGGLAQCAIVWFIHIPKTAGSTVREVLRKTNSDHVLFHDLNPSKADRHIYKTHGTRHNWTKPDLLEMARSTGKTIIVDAETRAARVPRDFARASGGAGAACARRGLV